MSRAVTILYFAALRDQIGTGEHCVDVPDDVTTVEALISYLGTLGDVYRQAFSDLARVRVAVDQVHVDLKASISGASEVAIFPPVTGG